MLRAWLSTRLSCSMRFGSTSLRDDFTQVSIGHPLQVSLGNPL